METSMLIDYEFGWRLIISFGIGTIIGIEREYRSKAAGLRTMIMICLGSTIFTEVSIQLGGDRIASTIVSGIGFLGAGVIFKDGLSVSGITTATTIWICAALGMAVGAGEYFIALVSSIAVFTVLVVFDKLQRLREKYHQTRSYKITIVNNYQHDTVIEQHLKNLKLTYWKKRNLKESGLFIYTYDVKGAEKQLDLFNDELKADATVRSYDY
jgi:putative Mg2+ transporter-C (MgtC) family protein